MLKSKSIPADAKRIAIKPLALGEKTGHHHSLMVDNPETMKLEDAVEMYEKNGETFVRIKEEGVSLVHQEHKAHPSIAPGEYSVVIQQENTDWGSRQVLD